MVSILIPIVCMVIGVFAGTLLVGIRQRKQTPVPENGAALPARLAGFTVVLTALKGRIARLRSALWRWTSTLRDRLQRDQAAGPARVSITQGRDTLRKCLDRVNLPGKERPAADEPSTLCTSIDPTVLNGRARIGRQPKGDTWQSVLTL